MSQFAGERTCDSAVPTEPGPAEPRAVIRPVEPSDGPAIHELLTTCIPDVLADRDAWLVRWEWQCWNNPFREGRPAGYVLARGDRVLGHLGAVYLPVRIADVHATAVVGADYAVGPDAATQGGAFAALELAQRLFADCTDCVVMATTANEKTGAVFGRFGCRPVGWTREFWRAPTSLAQQVRSCCGGRSRLIRRALNSTVGPWVSRALVAGWNLAGYLPHIPIRRGWSLETTVPQLARDLGQLWETAWIARNQTQQETWCSRPPLSVSRDQTYLDWRYARHPQRERIRVLVLRNSRSRPLGAAILFREERPDRNLLHVEDILTAPGENDAIRTLLCASLRLARQTGADYLVTSPGRRDIRDVYYELGFESRARNAPAVLVGVPSCQESDRGPAIPDPHDDHIEFWHGMMF